MPVFSSWWSIMKYYSRKYSEVCSTDIFIAACDISFFRFFHWVKKICSTHRFVVLDVRWHFGTPWCKLRAGIPEYAVVFVVLHTSGAECIFLPTPHFFFNSPPCLKFKQSLFHQPHNISSVSGKNLALIQFASALQSHLQLQCLSWSNLRLSC